MVRVLVVNKLDSDVKFTFDIPKHFDQSVKVGGGQYTDVLLNKYKKWNGVRVSFKYANTKHKGKFYQQIEPRKSRIVEVKYTLYPSREGVRLEVSTKSNAIVD